MQDPQSRTLSTKTAHIKVIDGVPPIRGKVTCQDAEYFSITLFVEGPSAAALRGRHPPQVSRAMLPFGGFQQSSFLGQSSYPYPLAVYNSTHNLVHQARLHLCCRSSHDATFLDE